MHSIRRQMLSSCRLAKVATEIGVGGKQETASLGADSGLVIVVIRDSLSFRQNEDKEKGSAGFKSN
jgi:hypothetical protein